MSTDQTPALARATEAYYAHVPDFPEEAGGWACRACEAHGAVVATDEWQQHRIAAALSEALHDPDDPDWLARRLAEQDGRGSVFGDVPTFLTGAIEKIRNDYRRQATAFVAAVLGEEG